MEKKVVGKKEFIKELSIKGGLSRKDAQQIYNLFVNTLFNYLVEEKRPVRLPELGIFQFTQRKKRRGVNPRTGEPITIPAKTVVKFKPSKRLQEKIHS